MNQLITVLLIGTLSGCGTKDNDTSDIDDVGDTSDTSDTSDTDSPLPEGQSPGDCDDGMDNDSDGLTDCDDDGCLDASECDTEWLDDGDCSDEEDNDDDGLIDCDDSDCAGSGDCPLGFEVLWSASDVTLEITNSYTDHTFGMAQTACSDPANCWTGEDCYLGFVNYNFCHTTDDNGVTLQTVAGITDIIEGSTTLFYEGLHITYYVANSSQCWVWGDDISYYKELGCTGL